MLTLYLSMIDSEEGKESFEEFYRKHELRCFHLACKVTNGDQEMAADALQNAFIAVAKDWEKFMSFSCNKQIARFVIIVKNKAIDLLREAKRKEYDEFNEEIHRIPDDSEDVMAIIESEEGYQFLLRCVEKLSPTYKTVFELKYTKYLSNKEIARYLGLTPEALLTRLCRARVQLQQILREEGVVYAQRK